LSDLQISDEVGVPKPIYTYEDFYTDKNGNLAKVDIIAMKELNAVSVEDVLRGLEEIPENFKAEDFWKKIRGFVAEMHEKGIYHRDLHGGNVMIGKSDGKPYVIDFGTAVYATEYDAYTPPIRRNVVRAGSFIRDDAGIDRIEKELHDFLTGSL